MPTQDEDHFDCYKCGLRFKIIKRLEGQKKNNPDEGFVPVCDDCFKIIMDRQEAKNGNQT